jgi:hypothetical protein
MAKITFNLEELIQILASNELLRSEILRPKVEGDKIQFVIKTESFVLPYIPGSIIYSEFVENQMIFKLTILSNHLNKVIGRLKQVLKLKLPTYMRLEYPKIFVDVDKLLEEINIRGIKVKDIIYKDGEFTVKTYNV